MPNLNTSVAKALSSASKVIKDNRKHITRADYSDSSILLDSENIIFPKIGSIQSRVLKRLIPPGRTFSHCEFDRISCSYRLGKYIGFLRDKGWTIVNHDEICKTKDIVPRKVIFTKYELFATFTPELQERIKQFCEAVDKFESGAVAAASANKTA